MSIGDLGKRELRGVLESDALILILPGLLGSHADAKRVLFLSDMHCGHKWGLVPPIDRVTLPGVKHKRDAALAPHVRKDK